MPSSKTFLELQSNAPGLPGPYLVENLAPYKILDDLGAAKPKAILAIGSSCKRRFVTSNFFVNHGHRDWSVGLACQPDDTLLFDCELHLQDDDDQGMPRFQARRPWGGGLNGHVLEHAERGAAHIAYKLYGEVLAPFSDVILVFVPDLGFGEVVELFCRWFKSAMEKKFPKGQRILLLHENMPQVQHVHSRLVAAFASMLRSSDALKAYTNADLRQRSNEAFHITNIALGSSTLTSEIASALADSVLRRAGHCLDFKAPHFKYLLQTAIRHHAEQPSSAFDVISASRLPSHISPNGLRDALGDFLGSRRDVGRTDVALVASALVLDAYPAGAHWFPPGFVFEYFYREATEHWGRRMRRPEFSQDVKVNFITIATNNRTMKSAVLDGHLMRVRSDWAIKNTMAVASCSLCILRAPHWTLDCKHRFCRECILLHGIFFIVTAFLEGWDLADCAHHLGHLKAARLRRGDTVAFGKHLTWDLSNPRLYNNKEVSLDFGRKILRHPGQSNKLYRRRTRLWYGAGALDQTEIELCTDDVVRRCRNEEPFMRELLIGVSSPGDSITIQLQAGSGRYYVSRCPYKIKDLIKDQGLDSPFCTRDRQPGLPCKGTSTVQMETQKLLELLRTMY
ncbi:hypothetical protein B0J15DRAFT_579026 [Fusarium solani]|uniref:RING-type domain-containing protein n=1 Tax=Fusarium solani TaxID=169388 RepID=A0A9P9KUH4_FUSSL|nr:uncharacterized protein B0J15DRAFT_579026 [Fusarium solani]KAH7268721.1 hypothetical protein B0J15DRAFT_579026 [Fusarium solani]